MRQNHSIYQFLGCGRTKKQPRWRNHRGCWLLASGRLGSLASASGGVAFLWLSNAGLLHRVVRRHREERSIRFCTNDALQPIGGLAASRIAVLGHHEYLQIRRKPLLDDDLDWLQISDRAGRKSGRRSSAGGIDAFDGLLAEILGHHMMAADLSRTASVPGGIGAGGGGGGAAPAPRSRRRRWWRTAAPPLSPLCRAVSSASIFGDNVGWARRSLDPASPASAEGADRDRQSDAAD